MGNYSESHIVKRDETLRYVCPDCGIDFGFRLKSKIETIQTSGYVGTTLNTFINSVQPYVDLSVTCPNCDNQMVQLDDGIARAVMRIWGLRYKDPDRRVLDTFMSCEGHWMDLYGGFKNPNENFMTPFIDIFVPVEPTKPDNPNVIQNFADAARISQNHIERVVNYILMKNYYNTLDPITTSEEIGPVIMRAPTVPMFVTQDEYALRARVRLYGYTDPRSTTGTDYLKFTEKSPADIYSMSTNEMLQWQLAVEAARVRLAIFVQILTEQYGDAIEYITTHDTGE